MTAYKVIIYVFSAIVELLTIDLFFSVYGERKKIPLWLDLSVWAAFIAANVVATVYIKIQIVFTLTIIALIALYSLRFKTKATKRVFGVVFVSILLILFEILFSLLFGALYDMSVEQVADNVVILVQASLFSKLSMYIVVRFIKSIVGKKQANLPWYSIAAFLVLPISTFLALYDLSYVVYGSNSVGMKITVFIASISLVVSNLIVFFIFDYILKQKEREKDIEARAMLLEYERAYYIELTEKQTLSNKTTHDLKNKLFAIDSLMETDVEEGKRRIKEMCRTVSLSAPAKIIGAEGVDGLIQAKKNQAIAGGVDFEIKAFVSGSVNIEAVDLCVVIGNLLDNALEACRKITAGKKQITTEISERGEYLCITVSNTVPENYGLKYGFKTDKADKNLHGYGLQNVGEAVERHSGELKYGLKDGEFIANVILRK